MKYLFFIGNDGTVKDDKNEKLNKMITLTIELKVKYF